MPVYEYKCNTCGKKLDVFQHSSKVLENCSEAADCTENGKLEKLISCFSFHGDQSASDSFMSKSSSDSSHGCACTGEASCPGQNIMAKYGLN